MADFRRTADLHDPQLREIKLLIKKPEDIDLWGGDDLTVGVDNTALVNVTEKKGKFGPHRRRFTLEARLNGSATLTATQPGGRDYVRPLKLIVPTPPTKQEFITKLVAEGGAVAKKYKLPVSIMVGQALLESANGGSDLALQDLILYGITKRSALSQGKEADWYPACNVIVHRMTIAKEGQAAVPDNFCSATTIAQAVEIWAQYVTKHPHVTQYQSRFKDGPWNEADLQAIADLMPKVMFGNGNPKYPGDLMKIVRENNLSTYDSQ